MIEPPLNRTLVQGDGSFVTIRCLSRRLAVCPISKHPGLLTTIEGLLAKTDFKVMHFRIEPEQLGYLHRGSERTREFARLPHASVFVLDGNSLNLGIESLIERIRTQYPRAKLLVIKETTRDEKVFPFLRMGVKGVVRYADAEKDLTDAVKAVAGGDFWIQSQQLVRFVDWVLSTPSYRGTLNGPGVLSRREREVLMSILTGQTNKEIASALNISERTVKFHVSHLLQKMGAHRRADLIARQHQLWPAIS